MLKSWKSAVLAAALAAGAMTAATSAEARDRYRGDNDAALAIGAGVVGLAVGAAIASGNRDRRYRNDYYYYDRGYPRHYYNQRAYRDRYHYDRQPRRHWRGDRYYRDDRYRGDRRRDYYRGDRRSGWGY